MPDGADRRGNSRKLQKNEAALAHFPIGGQMNDMKFHDWWKDRAIPKTRHGAKTALQDLDILQQTVLW